MSGRVKEIFTVILFVFMLAACAGQDFEDPALLQEARAAVTAETSFMRAWGAKPARVRAAMTPESMAMFPSMRGEITLLGTYGNYPDGSSRFALTMPQGTRAGSCLRQTGGEAECQSASPMAAVSNLVRASFASLDELFASVPGHTDGELWGLQKGDARGEVKGDAVVLVCRRDLGWGGFVNFVYDLAGRPLVFYRVGSQRLDWKLAFRNTGEKISYIFSDYRYDWVINVEIMEVRP